MGAVSVEDSRPVVGAVRADGWRTRAAGLTLIRAGDAAWFAPEPGSDGSVLLSPYAPSDVLRDLVALVQDSTARRGRS